MQEFWFPSNQPEKRQAATDQYVAQILAHGSNTAADKAYQKHRNTILRNLFEVSDKYDIASMNAFCAEEIMANAPEFETADLIDIGDKYTNVKILDAGFQGLTGDTARQMIENDENVWKKYSVTTKERLIVALGKLLRRQGYNGWLE